LLPRQLLRSGRGYENHCNAYGQNSEDTEADREIPAAQLSHGSIQGSRPVNRCDPPSALIDDGCSDTGVSL